MPPEYVVRFAYENTEIRVFQYGSTCVGEDAITHEPYCRLSMELDEAAPIGWFWLKDYSENRNLVLSMLGRNILQIDEQCVRVVHPGFTVKAARLVRKSLFDDNHGA